MLWQRGKAYGQDLRERVFAESDDGTPVGVIAEMLRVSVAYPASRRPAPCRPTINGTAGSRYRRLGLEAGSSLRDNHLRSGAAANHRHPA